MQEFDMSEKQFAPAEGLTIQNPVEIAGSLQLNTTLKHLRCSKGHEWESSELWVVETGRDVRPISPTHHLVAHPCPFCFIEAALALPQSEEVKED